MNLLEPAGLRQGLIQPRLCLVKITQIGQCQGEDRKTRCIWVFMVFDRASIAKAQIELMALFVNRTRSHELSKEGSNQSSHKPTFELGLGIVPQLGNFLRLLGA